MNCADSVELVQQNNDKNKECEDDETKSNPAVVSFDAAFLALEVPFRFIETQPQVTPYELIDFRSDEITRPKKELFEKKRS